MIPFPRSVSFVVLICCHICLLATEAAEPLITNIQAREQISLNGKWRYHVDQYQTGSGGFVPYSQDIKQESPSDRVEYSFDDADSIWVPGDWNTQKPKLYYFEGTIWYRKTFPSPATSPGVRQFLYFDAVAQRAEVFLNGEKLGEHEGGFTPFNFEVSGKLKPTGNSLIVGVSNRREEDKIPGMVTDWWNYGGITRDVRLVEVPATFIQDYSVQLAPDNDQQIEVTVELDNATNGQSVSFEIAELALSETAEADQDGIARFLISTPELQLWNPENPKRYSVSIESGQDKIEEQIGFRRIQTSGTKLVLNGEEIFLRGACLHEENPIRGGRAYSEEDARLLLGWAKEMNCNFVRLAHYPHNEHMARVADEMGILLWEELPLYWGIDWKNENTLGFAKQQFSELIRRDKNRASVIVWSIANETGDNPDRNHFLREVASHVRSIDNTRLLSAALKKFADHIGERHDHYIVNDPIAEILDIVSLNDYVGWYQGLPDSCERKSYEIAFEKPVVISEFGGGALQGFHGEKETRWTEEYQLWLYEENLKMFEKVEKIRGLCPWILVDFRSPLRQLPHIQDEWNRKGLISESGEKKAAFFEMQRYYESKK
ncbi:glycoside hydrolase family 2 protein [Pelagicoccus albus]|uniref:Beta-glucuronidase n=1 Tax=Pelagicoccus albus TaxID=415222 RepID=A0A7X1B8Q5_9BACT|nr:glycoside hydrolase family 2 TIM barrel-domain containing protein [Pelagicoccus albus]MBC2607750.1 beta-glucuronidase [Pelagicoccus albus]